MPEFKPTVMPREEQKVDNLGAPGPHVPENPESIPEFRNVRNVNAKDLNAKLQAEDAAKESAESKYSAVQGAPGIVQPSNPDEIKEFGQVRNVDAKSLNRD